MNCHNIISSLSKTMTGDEFIDNFLIPTNDGKLCFNMNDIYKLECPDDTMNKTSCKNNCYKCWNKAIKDFGFKFKEDSIDIQIKEIDVIDISRKYSFYEILKELNEDNSKVFFNDHKLYFIRNQELKSSDYLTDESITPESDNVTINQDILNKTFLATNITINEWISGIKHSEVNKFLSLGYHLIYVNDERSWSLYYKDNIINYMSYDIDIKDELYYTCMARDMLNSHIVGEWFIINDTKNN